MKAVTLIFLQDEASARGSSETYQFLGSTQAGLLVHATFQGAHPAFYLYTHSKLVVSYDPATGAVELLRRE
ncbi:MAG: hypothetical protein ACI8QC_004353 [Planctomycetota bacterium]|jgi:hypothetical protein